MDVASMHVEYKAKGQTFDTLAIDSRQKYILAAGGESRP
jgi:hypothetical protein